MKVSYNKPHLTYQQQLQKLIELGMTIDLPQTEVISLLSHCNYYRLSGYWHHKRQSENRFSDGVCISEIVSIYKFDKELRLLLLDAIEQIEVSVRTQFAYQLSAKYGAHFHLDENLFSKRHIYQKTIHKLHEEVGRSQEDFIAHLTGKYSEALPPIWASVEVMSLGQLSNWYTNIKLRQDALMVASNYGLDSQTLSSLLHHLTVLRNMCAHHARVWNRLFTISIQPPRAKPAILISAMQTDAKQKMKLYNTLVMMNWMLNIIQPDHDWTHRLLALLAEYPTIQTRHMGFPQSWRNHPIWSQA